MSLKKYRIMKKLSLFNLSRLNLEGSKTMFISIEGKSPYPKRLVKGAQKEVQEGIGSARAFSRRLTQY